MSTLNMSAYFLGVGLHPKHAVPYLLLAPAWTPLVSDAHVVQAKQKTRESAIQTAPHAPYTHGTLLNMHAVRKSQDKICFLIFSLA